MADAAHIYGSDLSVGPTGDIAMVTRSEQVRQRLIRRLETSPSDYIWHLDFGAGLPQFVGQPAQADAIAALIRNQLALEADVVQSPEPNVSVTDYHNGVVYVTIRYAEVSTGTVQTLVLPLSA